MSKMQLYILLLLLLRILLCTLYSVQHWHHLTFSFQSFCFQEDFLCSDLCIILDCLNKMPLSVHTSLCTFDPILHRWCILVHNRQRISRIISTIVNIAQTNLTAWKCERQLTNINSNQHNAKIFPPITIKFIIFLQSFI